MVKVTVPVVSATPPAVTFTEMVPCQPAAAPVPGVASATQVALVVPLAHRFCPGPGDVNVTTGAEPTVTVHRGIGIGGVSEATFPEGSVARTLRMFCPAGRA